MRRVRFRLGNASNLTDYDIIYQRISTFHKPTEQNMDEVSSKSITSCHKLKFTAVVGNFGALTGPPAFLPCLKTRFVTLCPGNVGELTAR